MSRFKRIGGQRGGHPAPAEGEPRSDHRHDGRGAAHRAEQIREQARKSQTDEHERDRQAAGVARGVRGRREGGTDHADHDRPDGQVLVATCVLAEQALGEEHQHQEAGGERRLDDHERGQHQGDDL
jgi:hypothetical protein